MQAKSVKVVIPTVSLPNFLDITTTPILSSSCNLPSRYLDSKLSIVYLRCLVLQSSESDITLA